ncbi:hypothetical protein FSB73_05370 [Arachidicoccus ginsenosidivorans]|uniref:Uncharacterized protein n=1 Tax=Arachidicoccus ginsenosidivorans TaxID=496057 RepID=A0A5B8VJ37_9BACT|nr:hypothetical protein [Arachidicoccus ginsenosidivorans]QEC71193.1 hypothetical protein FSB73_05370 [Arachidicoccus ginsenosidivorans]
MKKSHFSFKSFKSVCLLGLATAVMVMAASCSKSTDDSGIIPPVDPSNTTDVRGSITKDVSWTKDKVYRLRGYVYVEAGATLTIEPGTKIVSNNDSAGVLVIYKGAKINAKGTATDPIVFTSAETSPKPGDLGD